MNREEYEYGLYLAHHGIKGQKWGLRRFQNEDGSLTPSGEARRAKKESKQKFKEEVKAYQKESKDLTDQLSRSYRNNSKIEKAKREKEKYEKLRETHGDGPDIFNTGTGAVDSIIKINGRKINKLEKEKNREISKEVVSQMSKKYSDKVIRSAETRNVIKAGVKLLASLGILAGSAYAMSKIKIEKPEPKIDPRRLTLESFKKYYL